jgi:hypothetical protein
LMSLHVIVQFIGVLFLNCSYDKEINSLGRMLLCGIWL